MLSGTLLSATEPRFHDFIYGQGSQNYLMCVISAFRSLGLCLLLHTGVGNGSRLLETVSGPGVFERLSLVGAAVVSVDPKH